MISGQPEVLLGLQQNFWKDEVIAKEQVGEARRKMKCEGRRSSAMKGNKKDGEMYDLAVGVSAHAFLRKTVNCFALHGHEYYYHVYNSPRCRYKIAHTVAATKK